ncbi:alpha/beta fold hydrolase [Bradyrhizobium genosp. P]|uniref:alpha/beta fold hydrolase n=1 Tax=Bradyrhizobium genosp. P TaxID=83641 RepID=UPI003CEF118E
MLGNDRFTLDQLFGMCAADGEFRLAARHWTGGLRLSSSSGVIGFGLVDGQLRAGVPDAGAPGVIALDAPDGVWVELLAAQPKRFYNDISPLIGMGQITRQADAVVFAQYYPAVMRAIELLRPRDVSGPAREPPRNPGQFDSPIGRYIHLDLLGQDYRIYFEEGGSGIPLLLQHTAGCHGSQWRHLFERWEITDHFRLVAYDLPFHGKSLPPVGPKWWSEEYLLTKEFLRAVPISLAKALGCERSVFMGCSVGGMLALDLARHHSDQFAAVISLEGGLKIDTPWSALEELWHPQVSNEYKARLMNGLMSPTSPEAFRKETSAVYASGWPPGFRGDLYYYVVDYDLREEARKIDTRRTPVHILTGEYDCSSTLEHGQAAHQAVPGSTWQAMQNVGHFPMSENPDAFLEYLLPVLDAVRAAWHGAGSPSAIQTPA